MSYTYRRSVRATPAPKPAAGILIGGIAVASSILAMDWIAGLAVFVLWAGWRYLRSDEGPPVLALAFTFQWVQVTSGIFYYAITGRPLPAMDFSDYRPMVLIGLGCLLALLLGLWLGMRWVHKKERGLEQRPKVAFTWQQLLLFYGASTVLIGIVQELAWRIPQLTQAVLALTMFQYLTLFLICRRLMEPPIQWGWLTVLLLGEVALGFTGYFAGFREPLIIATLALFEKFDRRSHAHWVTFGMLASVILITGLVWTGVKDQYRYQIDNNPSVAEDRFARLELIASLSSQWLQRDLADFANDVDRLVDRLWSVYLPALAISRVPEVLPHTDGAILKGTVLHVLMPRLFFPEKAALTSDSEMVRQYSGVWVAGEEEGTSIAFGYAAESYIDFGLPWMFIPSLVFGLLMGMAYRWFLWAVRHRELAISLVTVIFWLSLYLFERSWIKTIGLVGTLMIYLGGATILIDRVLLKNRAKAVTSSASRSKNVLYEKTVK